MSLPSLIIIISLEYIIPMHTNFIKNHYLLHYIHLSSKKIVLKATNMPFSGPIRSASEHCKSLLSMFFAFFININIFKCMQMARNTLLIFVHINLSCKKTKSVKQRNRPISGLIRSDPVIRPDSVSLGNPSQALYH